MNFLIPNVAPRLNRSPSPGPRDTGVTPAGLAGFVAGLEGALSGAPLDSRPSDTAGSVEGIAIIGMAGRFPQAATLEEFWSNLRAGREAVAFFAGSETQTLPLEQAPAADDPHFVRARAPLEQPEWFDPEFFRLQPREAALMDPQQRVFLECAWEALENAGCNPDAFDGAIGVFAGAGFNTYLFNNLLTNRNLIADHGLFPVLTMNEKDYLATRVAYKLNLRGPAISVQTACSTSLVATSLACQHLLDGLCDVALAGGVSIGFPVNRGHHHTEGGIMSQDGHCRAFDAKATGTVAGSGAGVVVLKRLSDALAAGDRIVAVIKGSAVNNDGGVKMGYTAPGIDGQAECIATAQASAGCPPETISYVETHGTGTPLGDPIEIAALTKAFGLGRNGGGSCAIGSLKTNLGHLDVAAGVAGLIKTALALQHGEIPPSLHYETPNPAIDFAHSPFFVNAVLCPWPRSASPRRAGVSSFGIGGTNAHVVLEEAPAPEPAGPARAQQLLVLSARTPAALDSATENLAGWLERVRDIDLADAAFTLQTGRKAFEHRRAVVVGSTTDAVSALRARDGKRIIQGRPQGAGGGVVFMFPGQGAQEVNMARELYETEPVFRRHVDDACEIVQPMLGLNLRDVLFPSDDNRRAGAAELLRETRLTQPALFIIEHALARLWMSWGVTPAAMIGHSLGEYVAACLAGVFTLDEALAVVVQRASLMQARPAGAMLAIRLGESAVTAWLDDTLALAAINAPGMCVVSGPFDAMEALERKLAAGGIALKRLATSHAFHSAMMEPAMAPLAKALRRLVLRPPQIYLISNVTGTWLTPQEATSADYWTTQMRRPVRFADGLGEIVKAGHRILLEVGPGRTLAGLARQHPAVTAGGATVAATLERSLEHSTDSGTMQHALGQLWVAGVKPDWRDGFHAEQRRRIVALPTYPFERKRCWIEPGRDWPSPHAATAERVVPHARQPGIPDAESALGTMRPLPEAVAANGNGTETLAALMQTFHQLSGIELPSAAAEQTFNQLGFDSLFLAQASLAIERQFGVAIAFRQLRDEFSTLRKVAAHVDRNAAVVRAAAAGSNASPATRLPEISTLPSEPATTTEATEKRAPLTDAQREIWVVSQLGAAASAAYTEAAVMQLAGPLDVKALRRALGALVNRHEALRATFAAAGDIQIIAPPSSIDLSSHDCKTVDAAAVCVGRESERPFDLERGPLFRPVLARIDAQAHVLALIVHHIICDGWSLGILVRELADLYAAEVAERQPALPRAPLFSAYAAEAASERRAAESSASEVYWRKIFADSVPVLDLPTDRPRPASRSYAGDFVSCTLPSELSATMKQFCAEHESTVFTGLLAVFSVLLHRLTGQDDLVVGVPTAGQALEGHPDLVGHFANLIPIRSRLRDRQSFSDTFAEVHGQLSEALMHGTYPFVRLLQLLKLPRDSRRVPLTPVLFNTTHHRGTVGFADVTATLIFHSKRHVNFDLNFNLALTGEGLALGCYYSTELFDRSTVERWLGHFQTLLRGVLADPKAPVAEVSLLTGAERHTMLVDWNNTALAYRSDACIHDLFEEQVRRTPQAIAIVDQGERITYDELNRRAERLAAELRGAGVKPDGLVGIFLERSHHLLAAILAVLKAGGAYVPLDPSHPPQRRAFVMADTPMQWVVTQTGLLNVVQAPPLTRVVLVDGEGPPAAEPKDASATAPLSPKNIAYVIYTSGSTGEPKGVCVPHRGVVALIAWARQQYRPEELAGVLFATSATFDVSVFESLVPLCLGGKIILADNLLQLARLPAAEEVTLISGVPSAVAELLRVREIPRSVRTVNVAGEPCPQALVEALYALPHIERVYDLYGPTETTVYSTGSLRRRGGRATIGRPLPNEQVYLLDSRQQLVPIGVRGELYIGGEKLARGYLHRPALTNQSFLELPGIAAGRLYRTGDAARFLPDGTLEFLGRLDRQVKIRGCRIELAEIEAVLGRHPHVVESAAIVHTMPGGAVQLVAYAVLAKGRTVTPGELRQHALQWLPSPMVPVSIVLLDRLPRTSNEKLDRRALPEPTFGPTGDSSPLPSTETQRYLSEIWCDVLGVEQLGIHDNFFAAGGHSLHAMQVISRVESALGLRLTLREFIDSPTIAGLAPIIERGLLKDDAAAVPASDLEPSGR